MTRLPGLTPADGLRRLAGYPHVIASWVDDDGYPVSVALETAIDVDAGLARFRPPRGLALPSGGEVALTGSHIRPQPGYGYDQRRHVTVWGETERDGESIVLRAGRAWGWDEQETPFFEYSERSVPQSRRYFDALSAERGTPVRPRLSAGWLALRATRLPFVSATLVPVALGIAVAASDGLFDLWSALLTIVGATCIQLGLNVVNDVFDSSLGADDVNVTPTKFSGGSRVIQYGIVSFRAMAALAAAFYVAGGAIGLLLLATRGSTALLLIGALGILLSLAYTAPPAKLVYRGLGEVAVAVGFGPLMLLGAYVVQSGGTISLEALVVSIPVALLIALVLYVNEIPDRRGDRLAGKRTLPVRLSRDAVVRGYDVAAVAAYATAVIGVFAGVLPVAALLVLLTIPLARRVRNGLAPNYDNPYGLMAIMAINIRLHLAAGLLLLAAYGLTLVAGALGARSPLL